MTHRAVLLPISLLVVALLASGCGGSASAPAGDPGIEAVASASAAVNAAVSTRPAGPKLSKAAYVRKADAICRRMVTIGRRTAAEFKQAKKAYEPLAAANVLDGYLPAYTEALAALHGLSQPKHGRTVLTQLLQLIDNQAQVTPAQAAALRSSSFPAVNEISAVRQKAVRDARALGKRYGFKVCGRAVQTAH